MHSINSPDIQPLWHDKTNTSWLLCVSFRVRLLLFPYHIKNMLSKKVSVKSYIFKWENSHEIKVFSYLLINNTLCVALTSRNVLCVPQLLTQQWMNIWNQQKILLNTKVFVFLWYHWQILWNIKGGINVTTILKHMIYCWKKTRSSLNIDFAMEVT